MQLTPLSDQYGFLYAYPDGTIDSVGQRFWNATDACCNFFGSGVDDSGYLKALIDTIKGALSVDDGRVYVAGHSNGGFMSYRMACDHADTIAAVATLAGGTYFNPNACTPSMAVDVLQIHGTNDGTIFYNGGNLFGTPYPGAVQTTQTWATYSGCSLVPDTSLPNLDLVSNLAGAETSVARYVMQCAPGGTAETWTINGGVHSPSLSSDFSRLVVEFLLAHAKPGFPGVYCTAKVNSEGCTPAISASGIPSASAGSGFDIDASLIVAGNNGIFFYSKTGASDVPFQGGFLCLLSPATRTPPQNSGGAGVCGGAFTIDFNGWISGGMDPGLVAGATFWGQYWSRDPASPSGTNLTDAVTATIAP